MKFLIKEARERKGYTQVELAKLLNIAGSTLAGYESGDHDPKSITLSKIAQICDVSVDYLLGREEPKLSQKALELAYAYDNYLSDYGKAIIDCVMEQEKQ